MNQVHDLNSFLQALKERNLLFTTEKEVDWNHEIGSLIAPRRSPAETAGLFPPMKGGIRRVRQYARLHGQHRRGWLCQGGDHHFLAGRPGAAHQAGRWRRRPPVRPMSSPATRWTPPACPSPSMPPRTAAPSSPAASSSPRSSTVPAEPLLPADACEGKDKISIMINEWRHLKEFYDAAEAEDKALPIAIAIGADPVVYIGAGLRYDGDEMEVAGAILVAGP